MKVYNVHTRTVHGPKKDLSRILETLATKDDKVWPRENWPPMRFKESLRVGSIGGHGPIGYVVKERLKGEFVRFEFLRPKGFIGIHEFIIEEVKANETMITHIIDMKTVGIDTLKWILVIRPLHNALTEDALDKIENHFLEEKKRSRHSPWVVLWRRLLTPKPKKRT
ncbi:MAG: hypothetical protein AAFZ89_04450 [Bacteroidota bacterium]